MESTFSTDYSSTLLWRVTMKKTQKNNNNNSAFRFKKHTQMKEDQTEEPYIFPNPKKTKTILFSKEV